MTPVLTFPRDPERPPDGRVDEHSGRIVSPSALEPASIPLTTNPSPVLWMMLRRLNLMLAPIAALQPGP
jgi:hypothetical protein